MKKTKSMLLSTAVAGLLFGTAATTLTSCAASGGQATIERHACKGMNSCKGQGGCKTEQNSCKGMNACKGQGGSTTASS